MEPFAHCNAMVQKLSGIDTRPSCRSRAAVICSGWDFEKTRAALRKQQRPAQDLQSSGLVYNIDKPPAAFPIRPDCVLLACFAVACCRLCRLFTPRGDLLGLGLRRPAQLWATSNGLPKICKAQDLSITSTSHLQHFQQDQTVCYSPALPLPAAGSSRPAVIWWGWDFGSEKTRAALSNQQWPAQDLQSSGLVYNIRQAACSFVNKTEPCYSPALLLAAAGSSRPAVICWGWDFGSEKTRAALRKQQRPAQDLQSSGLVYNIDKQHFQQD